MEICVLDYNCVTVIPNAMYIKAEMLVVVLYNTIIASSRYSHEIFFFKLTFIYIRAGKKNNKKRPIFRVH